MAIGVIRIANSFSAMKTALENSGLFKSVITGTSGKVEAYDDNDNKVIELRNVSSGKIFAIYYNNGSSNTETYTTYSSLDVAYYTAKGVMFKFTKSSHACAVVLTKDNNGQIVAVFSPDTNDNKYIATRRSFSGTLSSFDYTEISNNQTALVPFVVSINDGEARSYTPDAFWIPISENYNIGWAAITIEGVQYVTNGHYALKDTEVV